MINKQIEDNVESKLLSLKNLYEKGLINEDDYNIKKKQILESI